MGFEPTSSGFAIRYIPLCHHLETPDEIRSARRRVSLITKFRIVVGLTNEVKSEMMRMTISFVTA